MDSEPARWLTMTRNPRATPGGRTTLISPVRLNLSNPEPLSPSVTRLSASSPATVSCVSSALVTMRRSMRGSVASTSVTTTESYRNVASVDCQRSHIHRQRLRVGHDANVDDHVRKGAQAAQQSQGYQGCHDDEQDAQCIAAAAGQYRRRGRDVGRYVCVVDAAQGSCASR